MQPSAPRDPPRSTLALPGVTLSYTSEGVGPTVVGISGLPGAHHHWRWLATPLFEWSRFLRVELPGFGEASLPGPVRPLSLQARGELVARFLEALNLRDVTVIGHSMGGVIALEAAVHHSERISAVGLVATPGPTAHFPEEVWKVFADIVSLRPLQRPLAWFARRTFKRLGFSLRDMTDEGALRTITDAAHTDFARHRANIVAARQPVLQTWADDDRLVPAKFHQELARARPEWKRLQFADGGHDVQKFHAIEVSDALRALTSAAAESSRS